MRCLDLFLFFSLVSLGTYSMLYAPYVLCEVLWAFSVSIIFFTHLTVRKSLLRANISNLKINKYQEIQNCTMIIIHEHNLVML